MANKQQIDPKLKAWLIWMGWSTPISLVLFFGFINWLDPKPNIATSVQVADKLQSTVQNLGRDLSKPSSRLVGHFTGSGLEYYISAVDSSSGLGNFAVMHDGKIERLRYRVDSEDLNDNSVTISAGSDANMMVPVTYWLPPDGQTLKSDSHQMSFMDSSTAP